MPTRTEVVSRFINFLDILPEDLHFLSLKGGGSQATLCQFDLLNVTYVLRLFPSQSSFAAREHQIALAKQAGELGFGPKIHFVDPEMKGMVMEFISGRVVQVTDFEDSTQLGAFAKFLKRLHLSEVEFPLAVSPFERFRDFSAKMDVVPSRFSEMQALMGHLEVLFQLFPVRHVPTHLDLHPLNIMVDHHRFCLVDWVNGGMCDPWFDLATFSVFHELNHEKALKFLTEYLERAPTEYEWNRFIVMQPIRPLVIAAALFSVHNDPLAESMLQIAIDLTDHVLFHDALNSIKKAVF